MDKQALWKRYNDHLCCVDALDLQLDVSRVPFDEDLFDRFAEPMQRAFAAMEALEGGALANPDEQRMVGHYWLRDAQRAPDEDIREDIERTLAELKRFATDVKNGVVTPQKADAFYVLLVVGIGGSALGPQFVADALGSADDPMIVRFIDNTDPDGIDRVLDELEETLDQTLTIVISKSGTTPETRNGMLEVAAAYHDHGLNFAKHAVAVTGEGSKLFQQAEAENWLGIFPMWDWVGGRTSQTSAVGLLPAALQGIDIDELLTGARMMDEATRVQDVRKNPAALLAIMWHHLGNGKGDRNLVVLPYSDRLVLFSRYLQQLIMESLGKELDRQGNRVLQGLTVLGNKGSTDQHAFVQQLREGRNDFFVNFIEVLHHREDTSIPIEPDVTAGDFLHGFLRGTRTALFEMDRPSITISVREATPRIVGALIALFERTVGLYAELIDINAYHQPGVEAGKKAAASALEVQRKVLEHLRNQGGAALTSAAIANAVGEADEVELIYHLLHHAAANPDHDVVCTPGVTPADATFAVKTR
jgi:glucose-6-phosphate isomerase